VKNVVKVGCASSAEERAAAAATQQQLGLKKFYFEICCPYIISWSSSQVPPTPMLGVVLPVHVHIYHMPE